MPKLYKGDEYETLREAVLASQVQGGYVTPGAGVNVNVAPLVGNVNGTDVESAGATNLTVTAGTNAGESIINTVYVDDTGAVAVAAGASATTGDEVAPTLADNQTALAQVTVGYGAAAIVQGNINNKVRNWT